MVKIIFKDGLYNGIDREIIQGETTLYLPKLPSGLEKIHEGKVASFDNNPYIFSEKELLAYKEKLVTYETLCYNSVIVQPDPNNTDIKELVNVHLSRDGFILEPEGSIEIAVKLNIETEYVSLKLSGSYTGQLERTCQLGEEVAILGSSNEIIADKVSDDFKLVITNPSDKVIIITELIFIY